MRCARGRRLPRSGRGPSRWLVADGTRRRRGRRLDQATYRRRPGDGRARAARVRLVRVIVTRPRGQEEELVRGLEALGHEVVHCPLIEPVSLGDAPVDVGGYDWVIVTSPNGARELRRRMLGTPKRVAA